MKVYVETPRTDWSLRRVINALVRYAPPEIEVVEDEAKADLVVLHVIGRRDRMQLEAKRLLRADCKYAVIQYALRSTQKPHTSAWLPLWRGATLVWSYYDLQALCAQDWTPIDFRFYLAPLGVDGDIFYPRQRERKFVIGTSGRSAVTEGIREAAFATKRVDRSMLHIGPELRRGPDIACHTGIENDRLAELLSECQFVAALRRTEGFELMAAEGLLCGARPICFDRTHYHKWYGPWAVFIHEGDREEVIDNLEAVFRDGTAPITEEERKAAATLFNWETVVSGFWQGVLDGC